MTRNRIEWIDIGNGYAVGTHTWKIVRGTGDYAHLVGHGRGAVIGPPNGTLKWRFEGSSPRDRPRKGLARPPTTKEENRMKKISAVLLCSLVLVAAGWTQGAAVAPPKCSDAGSPAVLTGWLPGHQVVSVSVPVPTTPNAPPPTWTRYCGPAVVLVRLHGASFRIHGGRCSMGAVLFGLAVGLQGSTPAAPAKWFGLAVSDPRHHAGAFRPFAVSTQLEGQTFAMPEQISTGTVTIGRSLRDGTFALRLRDATRVTGSWTCGGAIGSQSAEASPSGGAASAAAVAAGRWGASHGPYGGPAYTVAVAPSAPSVVYLGTARGVFASRNGGRSWHSGGLAVPRGSLQVVDPRITSLAVDPRAPATVFAARSMSIDGGFTFRQELFKSTNGGQSWRALGMAAGQVAVSPADPATVYAIAGPAWFWKTNRLFRSTNGGRSWQPADRHLASTHFWALAFDPTRATTVYAATARGVLTSTDGGTSWRRGTDVLSRQEVSAITVDTRQPQTVYAGTDGGVIKSIDGGRSWRMVNTVMGSHGRDRAYGLVSSLVVDPLDSQTVYATARCAGIFKSTDGGRSWSAANPSRDIQCLDTSLALDPRRSRTVYGVYAWRGVFKSTDGGVHWRATNTGLSLTTVSSLAVDTNKPQVVYASAGQLGLFKSSDGGANWRPVARGLVNAVALDPRDPRIVLAAEAHNRVLRSTDAGRTWQPTGPGVATTPGALAISGDNAYAATSRGVYSSSDGGRSWREPPPPLNSYAGTLAIAPDDPAVVYAGHGGSHARGLYRSTDAGRSWQRLTGTTEAMDISALALDPRDPTTIYIGTGDEGVFKSTDDGAGWRPASSGLPRIRIKGTTVTGKYTSWTMTVGIAAFAIDPAHPTTLYAATNGRGIFRSTDAGSSWHPFNAGLAVLDVKSLAIDKTGRTLYAGTVNGGVVELRVSTK